MTKMDNIGWKFPLRSKWERDFSEYHWSSLIHWRISQKPVRQVQSNWHHPARAELLALGEPWASVKGLLVVLPWLPRHPGAEASQMLLCSQWARPHPGEQAEDSWGAGEELGCAGRGLWTCGAEARVFCNIYTEAYFSNADHPVSTPHIEEYLWS